jgi:CBS domain-containing protein
VDERNGSLVPVGLLTDRDIVTAVVAKGLDVGSLLVGEVMSTDPVTVRDSEASPPVSRRCARRACVASRS